MIKFKRVTSRHIECVRPIDFPTHVILAIIRAMVISVDLRIAAVVPAVWVLVDVRNVWGRVGRKLQMDATVTLNGICCNE